MDSEGIIALLFLKVLIPRNLILEIIDQTISFEEKNNPVDSEPWRIKQLYPDDLERTFGRPKLQAVLLLNRQIKSSFDAESYLASDERLSCDSKLLPNIDNAIKLVTDAISSGDLIAIYGDFDVDGISATAVLSEILTCIGASVTTYIPHRVTEGHSLNTEAITHLASQNVKLIITVDCGTTAYKEVSFAKSLGMKVVVTDHHIGNEPMPDDVPVVNPGLPESIYPFKDLTGAGVALKFSEALCAKYDIEMPKHLYTLAALGTIADIGPLTGENRFIVKNGLLNLGDTDHIGLKALARKANCNLKTITARDLSFTLIPRLNAAGRLGSADTSLEILITKDIDKAEALSEQLEQINVVRRNLSTKAIKLAKDLVRDNKLSDDPALFICTPDWHPGILGLIAGKLSEEYRRPVVAACVEGENVRASIRSPKGYEVLQGLLDTNIKFLKIGGHSQAAGFTLQFSEIDSFKARFLDAIKKQVVESSASKPIEYESEIMLAEIDKVNLKFFKSLEPFGKANPQPVFLSRGLNVYQSRTVGKTDAHIKLIVGEGSTRFDAIGFGLGLKYHDLGNKIDAIYKLSENHWAGKTTIQLHLIDFISV